LAVLALAAFWAGVARAHSELVRSQPAAGSTAPAGLRELVLEFNEPIGGGSTLTIFAGTFSPTAGVETSVEGQVLTARLAEPLPAGTYTVEWRVIGADGHPVQGSYQFAVSAGGAQATSGWLRWGAGLVTAVAAVAIVAASLRRVSLRRRGS
jgi:methionine-rich copper-binding protein CopC